MSPAMTVLIDGIHTYELSGVVALHAAVDLERLALERERRCP